MREKREKERKKVEKRKDKMSLEEWII